MKDQFTKECTPTNLEWLDEGKSVRVTWADEHVSVYSIVYLRKACPCAQCRGAHDEPPLSTKPKKKFNVLTDKQAQTAHIPARVIRAYPIGNYALGFDWSDGHNEGIYSYEMLREICPCDEHVAYLRAQSPGEVS